LHCTVDERCGDGVDDDCDGEIDEDCEDDGTGGASQGDDGTGGPGGDEDDSGSDDRSLPVTFGESEGAEGCACTSSAPRGRGTLLVLAIATVCRRRRRG
jgi:hypothetical protein